MCEINSFKIILVENFWFLKLEQIILSTKGSISHVKNYCALSVAYQYNFIAFKFSIICSLNKANNIWINIFNAELSEIFECKIVPSSRESEV